MHVSKWYAFAFLFMSSAAIARPTTVSAPGNLKAVAISTSEIDLSWSASSVVKGNGSVSSYLVYRNGSSFASVPASQTAFKDLNRAPSTTYTYQVAAVSSSGQKSPLSSSVQATTLAAAPAPAPTPDPQPAPAPTPTPTGALPPPSGYASATLLFQDLFTSPTLDTSKWNPWLGDDLYGRWGDKGLLPSPYSGMNCDSTCSNSFQTMYYDPYPYGYSTNTTGNHLVGGNGVLSLIANASTRYSSLGYSWASSAISSYGKAYLPATGGYVQWRAKMPDSRNGAWAGLWLLSKNGAEMDIQESGYVQGPSNANYVLASHWQGTGGTQIIQNTGVDLSADYHVYGVEYRPGQSWKVYLDGKLMATWTTGVPTGAAYQVLIDLEIAGPNTTGWHTVANPATNPGPFQLNVTDVQIYSLP